VQVHAYDNINRLPSGTKLEADAFQLIVSLINEKFDIKKSHEGCHADMIIKPKYVSNNEWMGIQLKSRTNNGDQKQYSFNKIGKYQDMIVVCVSIPEYKIWIFKGNDLLEKRGISIGKSISKYDINEVKHENVSNVMFDFYQNSSIKKFTDEQLMTPTNFNSRQEHKYRLRREQLLTNVTFTYPTIDGTKHDLVINKYKVQDKCSRTLKKGKSYLSVYLDYGYIKGDNDFYWINNPDESVYIIPESELLNKNDNTIKKSLYMSACYDQFKYGPEFTPEVIQKITMLFQPEII
jgi:hypothetical protein